MKLGAIPTLVFLIIFIYLAIPSTTNIGFKVIDGLAANYCPDMLFCDMIPQLKALINIIGDVGVVISAINLIIQMFKGQWFFAKEEKKH